MNWWLGGSATLVALVAHALRTSSDSGVWTVVFWLAVAVVIAVVVRAVVEDRGSQ